MTNPNKYSEEWYAENGDTFGHRNPVMALKHGWPVRLSKSAFMTYLSCPRKYWWDNVVGLRGPPNWYMTHGIAVHTCLENLYGNWTDESPEDLRPLMDSDWKGNEDYEVYEHEGVVDALAELEAERLKRWGAEHFAPVEFEVKHVIPHPDHPFTLVGMIDGVHRHPDGGLVITELKTGKASKSKMTKTRKELCYYRYMLSLLGWDEAIYFYYLFPECENIDLYLELEGKKNTEVWLGTEKGMAVLEKVSSRSVTAMHKSLNATCEGIVATQWPQKWNDWFCTEWCEYSMSCESEQIGLEPDPTVLYSGDKEWT